MEDEMLDVIVIGAGLAGSTVALKLAQQGREVLLVERGNFAGAKNMSGGRLYTHTLAQLVPNFREVAPLERRVVKEKISILSGDRGTTVEYTSRPEGLHESYTVLRSKFDRWLCEEAEQAGAMVVTGVQATELLMEGDRVIGIRSGEDTFYARVVVLADGVNSILAEKAGLRKRVDPKHVAVGAKDVFQLDRESLSARCQVKDDEGAAWLFLGDMTEGQLGGGFIYTNADSLSVGIVAGLGHLGHGQKTVEDMLDELESHPCVAPLLEGAKLIEHSGHVVPEAGYAGVSTLSGNGYVIVGDAAGLCMNLGYTVRGMDLAIASGLCAAEAIEDALKANDFSAASLQRYETLWKQCGCGKDLEHYAKMPAFMDNDRIFKTYPVFVNDMMDSVFKLHPEGAPSLFGTLWKQVKDVGPIALMKDAWKGVRSL